MAPPSDPTSSPALTIDDVVEACRSLPEPGWHRVLDHHPAERAAVALVPLTELRGEAAIVVTKRASGMDHGGDWVFPGGGVAPDDASPVDAARRETVEELGVEPSALRVVGQLTTRGPTHTGFVIDVYVGVIESGATFSPDPQEVAAVEVVPLGAALAAGGHLRGPAPVVPRFDPNLRLDQPSASNLSHLRHYRVGERDFLWGLQADILHELLRHLTDGRHDF